MISNYETSRALFIISDTRNSDANFYPRSPKMGGRAESSFGGLSPGEVRKRNLRKTNSWHPVTHQVFGIWRNLVPKLKYF